MRNQRRRNHIVLLGSCLLVGLASALPCSAAVQLAELLVDGATLAAGEQLNIQRIHL